MTWNKSTYGSPACDVTINTLKKRFLVSL